MIFPSKYNGINFSDDFSRESQRNNFDLQRLKNILPKSDMKYLSFFCDAETEPETVKLNIHQSRYGKMKIIAATNIHPRWNDSGSTSIFGTDRFGFGALPSGERYFEDGLFFGNGYLYLYWSASSFDASTAWGGYTNGESSSFAKSQSPKTDGKSIRAVRTATTEEQLLPDGLIDATYPDIDGNIYPCTKIGTQVWTTTNLKVTKYADGTPIPTNLSDAAWSADTVGAMAVYGKNDSAFMPTDELITEALMVAAYGRLYNWYAVNNAHGLIDATDGWNAPTDAEFTTLTDYLISTYPEITIDNVGDVLKSYRQVNSPYKIPYDFGDKTTVEITPETVTPLTSGFLYFFKIDAADIYADSDVYFSLQIDTETIYSEIYRVKSESFLQENEICKLIAYNNDNRHGFLDVTYPAFGFFKFSKLKSDIFLNKKTEYDYSYSRKMILSSENQIGKRFTFLDLTAYQANLLRWLCNCENLFIDGIQYYLSSDFTELEADQNSEIVSLQADFVEVEQSFFTRPSAGVAKNVFTSQFFIK